MSGEVEIASESDFLCLFLDNFCEEIEVGTMKTKIKVAAAKRLPRLKLDIS